MYSTMITLSAVLRWRSSCSSPRPSKDGENVILSSRGKSPLCQSPIEGWRDCHLEQQRKIATLPVTHVLSRPMKDGEIVFLSSKGKNTKTFSLAHWRMATLEAEAFEHCQEDALRKPWFTLIYNNLSYDPHHEQERSIYYSLCCPMNFLKSIVFHCL